MPKLQNVDVQRLSGGKLTATAAAEAGQHQQQRLSDGGDGVVAAAAAQKIARRNDNDAVDAARQRYLQRKQTATAVSKRK